RSAFPRDPCGRDRTHACRTLDPQLPALRRARRGGHCRLAAPEARMSGWQALDDEIARWRDPGRGIELWWRDDDAGHTRAALGRLRELQRAPGGPLALAVVPAHATEALAKRLAAVLAIDVLQHGYAHANHALPPDKKCELGPHRPAMLVLGELGTGRMAMERL